jgi:hypothetical protein
VWRSVCLNAKRIKPSSLARNSVRLRSSGPYDCFARELRDYCEYRLACPIVLDTRKNANREASTARSRGPASRFVERQQSGRSAYWTHDLQKAHVWGFKISLVVKHLVRTNVGNSQRPQSGDGPRREVDTRSGRANRGPRTQH